MLEWPTSRLAEGSPPTLSEVSARVLIDSLQRGVVQTDVATRRQRR